MVKPFLEGCFLRPEELFLKIKMVLKHSPGLKEPNTISEAQAKFNLGSTMAHPPPDRE
jgi:hypothetical protein